LPFVAAIRLQFVTTIAEIGGIRYGAQALLFGQTTTCCVLKKALSNKNKE